MKRCSRCTHEKPLTAFYKNRSATDGYDRYCKVCRKAVNAEWRMNNLSKCLAAQQRWRDNNPGKAVSYSRRWQLANNAKNRVYDQRRNAKKRNLPATLTVEEWDIILERFGHRCAYCGTAGRLAQDHVIPIAQGGGYTADNIVPACKSCNSSKGGRTPEQAGMVITQFRC